MEPDQMPLDKLAIIRLKIRDKKTEVKKAFDAEYERLTKQEEMIDVEFMRRADAEGVDGFKMEGIATVFFTETMKVSGSDWTAFGEFLKTHDPLEFLEHRVSSKAVQAYMKANDGELPSGVSIFKARETRVRRAGEK